MGFGQSVKNFLADAEGFSLRPTWKMAMNGFSHAYLQESQSTSHAAHKRSNVLLVQNNLLVKPRLHLPCPMRFVERRPAGESVVQQAAGR